ncbi:MAG: hypothetical protein AAF485_11185, partial [Chloroflexota bacterium]
LDEAIADEKIVFVDGFYSLAGKPDLVATRQRRYIAAQQLWPKAINYSRWIAALPFVKMVAITGSLAMENPRDGIDDIDYLIVTQTNRLWFCRALVIMMVRYGHLRGVHLCPNYLLTENVIYFEDRNLFTARELLQMIPLYGEDIYIQMRESNVWVADYLPQGTGTNLTKINDKLSWGQRFLKRVSESLFGGFIGDRLEAILQKIQISKHQRLAEKYNALDKVIFTADICKGHYDSPQSKTMNAYQKRVKDHTLPQDHNLSDRDLKQKYELQI